LNSVALTNGTIAPSTDAAAGVLTTLNAASLTWNGGTLSMRLGDSGNLTSSDRIVLSGAFTRGTGPSFTFDFNGTGVEGGNYTLMTFASSTFNSSNFTISNLAPGLGSSFTMNSTSLVLNVVPEPGTWALLLVAAILLAATNGKARLRLGKLVRNGKNVRCTTTTKPRGAPAG